MIRKTMEDCTGRKKRTVGFSSSNIGNELRVVPNAFTSDIVDVYVGFLKVHHKYSIHFKIPNMLGATENVYCSSPSVGIVVTKLLFHAKDIAVNVEYECELKEGVIEESFLLLSEKDNTKQLKVLLHMEVLRKDQGTPALKQGVKCIETLHNYDSEQSDWQGF